MKKKELVALLEAMIEEKEIEVKLMRKVLESIT